MRRILIIVLSIIAVLSLSVGLTACDNNGNDANKNANANETETEFTVLDSDGNEVSTSDTTWLIDEEVKAVKILGNDYILSGKTKYPIFVENEEVAFMTWKNLEIVSDKGFGFSVWNTDGVIITLEGDNGITANGYSEYLKTEKQILGNMGIDMGADLTFVGDGNLNITCGKVRTDLTVKKAFNCGIYSCTGDADLSIATSGKINMVIDKAEGTATTNVLQVGILSDLSVFRMVSGEVDIDIKSSICSNAEVNVYGVFGIFAFDGGKISINVEKRTAYKEGEALALYITENLSSVDFAVANAESIETDIGYKLAQKETSEKVIVSENSEEVANVSESDIATKETIRCIGSYHGSCDGIEDGKGTPTGAMTITVRGAAAISATSVPLYVTDGEDGATSIRILGVAFLPAAIVPLIAVDGVEDGENVTMPEVQTITFVVVGSEKYEDGSAIGDEDNAAMGLGIWYISMGGTPVICWGNSTDGECYALVWSVGEEVFANGTTDGEGAISIIGGGEGGEEQGETDTTGIIYIEIIYIGIIEQPVESIPVQSAVVMSLDDLRPVTMEYVLADGEASTDAIKAANVIIGSKIRAVVGSGVVYGYDGVSNAQNVFDKGTYEIWLLDLKGAVPFRLPLLKEGDPSQADGEEGEGEQWTVSNEGGTIIIVVPQGDRGFFRCIVRESVNGEDGEGAISIIGGEEQGSTTGGTQIIILAMEPVLVQSSVIMSMEDLRPMTVEYVLDSEEVADAFKHFKVEVVGWGLGGIYDTWEEYDAFPGKSIPLPPAESKKLVDGMEIIKIFDSIEDCSFVNVYAGRGGRIYLANGGGIYEPWEDKDGDGFSDIVEDLKRAVKTILEREIRINQDNAPESYDDGEAAISIIGGADEETQSLIKSRILTLIGAKHISEINEDIALGVSVLRGAVARRYQTGFIYVTHDDIGVQVDGEEDGEMGLIRSLLIIAFFPSIL